MLGFVLSATALASAVSSPAPAFEKQAADNLPIRFDCDAPANRFSQIHLPIMAPPFTVTGSMHMRSALNGETYGPVGRVMISGPNQEEKLTDQPWAGLSLTLFDPRAPTSAVMLEISGHNPGQQSIDMPLTRLEGKIASFVLSYDGHNLTVDAAGQHREMGVTMPRPVLALMCSTGEFWFTGLTVKPGIEPAPSP